MNDDSTRTISLTILLPIYEQVLHMLYHCKVVFYNHVFRISHHV